MGSIRAGQWAVVFFLVACGGSSPPKGDYTITMIQENSSPAGFISGRVLDTTDGKPVPGALISAFADGPVSVVSDSNGLYRLGPIPAGSYTVFCEAIGYLKRSFPVAIQTGSSMFPVGNTVVTLEIELSHPDATIEGQVLTNTGQIAKGAALYIDLRQSGIELVATTKTDENGKFKFSGMPGAAFGQFVSVLVAPYDENGDGIPDYSNTQRSYSLFPGFTTYNTITLFALGVQLVTSNIADADLLPTESVVLTFSGSIRANQSTVTLFRNSGSVQVGAMLTWDATTTIATLKPIGGPLVEGQAYFVSYSVRATNGAVTTASINFVVRPPLGAPPLGVVKNFRLTIPTATDSGLLSASFAWDGLLNAGGYRIYGKDAASASAYLLLATISSGLTTQATVNLSLFDSVQGDAFNSPLGHKNKIQLAIVATDRLGTETSLSAAATVELADNVPPTIGSAFQLSGSAGNLSGGSVATVVYQVTFSELMATDTTPQITLPNPATSAVWLWTSSNRGTFTITIPAGIDGRGTLSVSGTKDTSDLMQTIVFDGPLQ